MKNLKIRTKLLILALFLLLCLLSTSIMSLQFMGDINDGSTVISQNWLPSVIAAEELNTLTSDFRIKEYSHIVSEDSSQMEALEVELNAIQAEITSTFNQYSGLITNDTDRQLMKTAQDAWSKYQQIHAEVIGLSHDNRTQEARALMEGDSKTLFETASNNFLEIVEFNKAGGVQASEDGDTLYASAQRLTIVILVVVVIIGMAGSMIIIRSITKPVREIDQVARKIADGQLNESITYKSKDELGVLAVNFNKTVTRLRDYVNYIDEISKVLNEVADGNLVFTLTYDYAGEFAKVKSALENISDSLNETMSQINQSSDQVASGSDQVSSGAQALSQGATEQASSIEELAATINEISDQIRNNASSVKQARENVDKVGGSLLESKKQMEEMTLAMSEISESSNEIGKIIKTIEDIAFQTNILALNAAVEAARAGEAGKGFAVVADEVRNLASKSSEASKSTAALIERSLSAVEHGARIADETAASLLAVVDGTQTIEKEINQISSASEIQATSAEEVTKGVEQISSVVQTNSATAEESAAASEELSGQAQLLKDLVSKFRLKGSVAPAETDMRKVSEYVPQERKSYGNDKY